MAGLLCALCLAVAGCGDSGTSGSSAADRAAGEVAKDAYPAAVAKRFTRSCVVNAGLASGGKLDGDQASEICSLALACLERRLTFAEFVKAERLLLSGQTNPGARTIRRCAQKGALQVAG